MKFFALILTFAFFYAGCGKPEPPPLKAIAENSRIDSMKKAMKGWIEAVNADKFDELDKYFAPDIIDHPSFTSRKGELQEGWLKEIKQLLANAKRDHPEGTYTVEAIIAEGDLCAARALYHDTKTVDSKSVTRPKGSYISTLWARWENGKFVEIWGDNELR